MSRTNANSQSNHALTQVRAIGAADRPITGAVHPAGGTIAAPILVVGATGTIGRKLTEAFVEYGRPVIAVAADRDRLEALARDHASDAVTALTEHVGDDRDAGRLATRLRHLGRPLAGVVVALPIARPYSTDE